MSERYNGWKNYETWAVNLWLENDKGSEQYWSEQAQEAWDDAEADETFTREEKARFALADQLKEQITDNTPEVTGLYADLVNAALCEVDWDEIAESWMAGVDREVETEETTD